MLFLRKLLLFPELVSLSQQKCNDVLLQYAKEL